MQPPSLSILHDVVNIISITLRNSYNHISSSNKCIIDSFVRLFLQFCDVWLKIFMYLCIVRTLEGEECVFPFRYLGLLYSGCTRAGLGTLWCAVTDTNILTFNNNNWGFCNILCKFMQDQDIFSLTGELVKIWIDWNFEANQGLWTTGHLFVSCIYLFCK